MKASTLAIMEKSGSVRASFLALILPQNSCMSARGWAPFDKTIRLGEEFVFNADCGDVALLEFADEPLHIIEVAVSRVAIQENRNRGRIGHEFQVLEDLGPAGFVAVTDAELRGNGEAAGPDASKAGFLNDLCADAIVGLTDELKLLGQEEFLKLTCCGDTWSRTHGFPFLVSAETM